MDDVVNGVGGDVIKSEEDGYFSFVDIRGDGPVDTE